MQRRTRDITLALTTLLLTALLITHQLLTQHAQKARHTLLANLKTPPQVQYYQDLAATTPTPEPTASPQPQNPCGTPQEIIAQWAALFNEAPRWTDTNAYTEPYITSSKPKSTAPYEESEAKALASFLEQVRALATCGGPLYPLTFPKAYQDGPPLLDGSLGNVHILLIADARAAAANNNFDRSVQNIIASLQIFDALAHEPLFQSQRSRYNFYKWSLETFANLNHHYILSPDLMEQVAIHLNQAHHREGLYNILAAQSDRLADFFERWHNTSFSERLDGMNFVQAASNQIWAMKVCEPFALENENTTIEFTQRLAALPNVPLYQIRSELEKIRTDANTLGLTNQTAKGTIPKIIDYTFPRQARHEITVDIARLRLLANRYRAEFGNLPATLQEVASYFDESLPIDPSNGLPYRYEPDGDCYLLTSTGAESIGGSPHPLGEEYARLCPQNNPTRE